MSNTLRSMTGFARARRHLGDGEIVVSAKTVNHRGLDVQVRAPEAADPFEGAIRAAVKNKIARGHVEVRVSLPKSSNQTGSVALNRDLMDTYLKAFREASELYGLDSQPDLNGALRMPGMLDAGDV